MVVVAGWPPAAGAEGVDSEAVGAEVADSEAAVATGTALPGLVPVEALSIELPHAARRNAEASPAAERRTMRRWITEFPFGGRSAYSLRTLGNSRPLSHRWHMAKA
jgi:hypothetical protein